MSVKSTLPASTSASLNYGRTMLAIPGPSIMPERVLSAMHRPSPNIYEGELLDITASLIPDLKAVARTAHHAAIYIANGHGAWEAALRNTLNAGDKVLVLYTGRFAAGWAEVALGMGVETQVLEFGMQGDGEPDQVEAVLRADKEGAIKAVMCVQTDTASSISNNIAAMRQAIDNAKHDALFMVDCIASLGCERFEMDAWGVDVMVAACQKGLMVPAGISFVFFNDKAAKASQGAKPGVYWDWTLRAEPEVYYQYFCGTAPTQHLFGLREALDMLVHEEGVEAAWARHETIANAYWDALDVWAEAGALQHNIAERGKRSKAVSTVKTKERYGTSIRQWCEHQGGVTLGIGLGFGDVGSLAWDSHFRIGHMGHQNIPMVLGVVGTIDTALKTLNIPHGNGAIEAAALRLSQHGS